MNSRKWFDRLLGSFGLALSVVVFFAAAYIAAAALTISGTTISGDSAIIIDGSSTISIGTSTATAITIGSGSSTVSFPGTATIGATALAKNIDDVRVANEYSGASIVEQIQAAVNDCGSGPCTVYVPPGSYTASDCSTWQQGNPVEGLANVGVLIPSNVSIVGAGQGVTTIAYTRSASDPVCSLFANKDGSYNGGDANIELAGMTIVATENNASASGDAVPIYIEGVDQFVMHDMTLQGNTNKLVNVNDATRFNIHDNAFLLNTTSYAHGDNALGVHRFNNPAPLTEGGIIQNNKFMETGSYGSFSALIVAQSNVSVLSNTFDLTNYRASTTTGNALEIGKDNFGTLSQDITISGNNFSGGSGAFPIALASSLISNNYFYDDGLTITPTDGTTDSATRIVITGNQLEGGSIGFGNVSGSFTGTAEITGNTVDDGGIDVGGSGSYASDVIVSDNTVRASPNVGITCGGCSVVTGNIVKDVGQASPSAAGNVGYSIDSPGEIISDNVYMDDQQNYSTGSVCSVASSISTTCLTDGVSQWVYGSGATWAYGWTNRTLYTAAGNYTIRAFINSNHLELEQPASFIPLGTNYNLYETTELAFEIDTNSIEQFTDNSAYATAGTWGVAALQEDPTVSIGSLEGNVFAPYSCKYCGNDYQDNLLLGNVGIGTTVPSTTLQVAGTLPTVRIGASSLAGCLEVGNSDGSAGINYVTFLNGVMNATTTKQNVCQ